ncbi:hypothetical protein D2V71_05270 [Salmonella enterica]|nr:hypothetical protein [Salmonella enterica]
MLSNCDLVSNISPLLIFCRYQMKCKSVSNVSPRYMNKPKNKEYGFRCQTWQTRCKRNKAAVDKAFMPHSGKQP